MISALSGSASAAALLSVFSKPTDTPPNSPSSGIKRTSASSPALPPPSGSGGASAEAMFASILAALTGQDTTQGSDADDAASTSATSTAQGGLADALTKLVSALDTNGDGQLSAEELKAGVQALQEADGADHPSRPDKDASAPPPDPATTPVAATAKDAAKSLYESLFNAVTSQAPDATTVTISADVAQKFLSALHLTA